MGTGVLFTLSLMATYEPLELADLEEIPTDRLIPSFTVILDGDDSRLKGIDTIFDIADDNRRALGRSADFSVEVGEREPVPISGSLDFPINVGDTVAISFKRNTTEYGEFEDAPNTTLVIPPWFTLKEGQQTNFDLSQGEAVLEWGTRGADRFDVSESWKCENTEEVRGGNKLTVTDQETGTITLPLQEWVNYLRENNSESLGERCTYTLVVSAWHPYTEVVQDPAFHQKPGHHRARVFRTVTGTVDLTR